MFKRFDPLPKVGDTVKLRGLDVKVVSDAEAEACSIVVCGPLPSFHDDVQTICSWCGDTVFHRPFAPKKPPKICADCLLKWMAEQSVREESVRAATTVRMLDPVE